MALISSHKIDVYRCETTFSFEMNVSVLRAEFRAIRNSRDTIRLFWPRRPSECVQMQSLDGTALSFLSNGLGFSQFLLSTYQVTTRSTFLLLYHPFRFPNRRDRICLLCRSSSLALSRLGFGDLREIAKLFALYFISNVFKRNMFSNN